QQLVAGDLELLERARKAGELARRVGMEAEEEDPVERAEAERRVLEAGWIAADLVEPRHEELGMVARLHRVVLVDARERRRACELVAALEQRQRLLLERVRVCEIRAQLRVEILDAAQ